MRKTMALLLVLVLTALSIVGFLPVKAEARTIIVPDHYSTIVAAIASADKGDTIFFKKGTYEGPINQTIVVDKAISIVGENAQNTIIKLYPAYDVTWILTQPFFSYSDAITFTANACKLLNLTVIIANLGRYISATGNRNVDWSRGYVVDQYTDPNLRGAYPNMTLSTNFWDKGKNFKKTDPQVTKPEPQEPEPKEQEPFPVVPVVAAASAAVAVVAGAGMLLYFKKRKC